MKFEGEHLAGGYAYALSGIIYSGSSGTIEDCSVSGFRMQRQLTGFNGFGVVAGNNTTLGAGPVAVRIRHSTFQDKDLSILVKGADAASSRLLLRLSFTIEGNTITGIGPTANGTQDGIWISPGATGEVKSNTITDHVFIGPAEYSTAGILAADWMWLILGQTPPAQLLPVTYQGTPSVTTNSIWSRSCVPSRHRHWPSHRQSSCPVRARKTAGPLNPPSAWTVLGLPPTPRPSCSMGAAASPCRPKASIGSSGCVKH